MKRSRLLHLVWLTALLTAGLASAATIPLTGDASRLATTGDGLDRLDFKVEIGRIETIDVNTKGGGFTRLVIPGFHSSHIEGEPELPMMNRLVAVPFGAKARLEVANVRTTRVSLADYGIDARIMPAQPSLSKSADPASVPFAFDNAAYGQYEVRRELVNLVPQGRLRAMDLARLEISPVAYFPGTGELEIVTSMDVSVVYDGADAQAAGDLIARTYSPFFEHLYDGVAGVAGFHDSYPDRVRDVVTMVIVTPPAFAAQLQDFVAWKTERGFHTILAVTGTPDVGTTSASIQAYLHGLYNNATPELPAPSFVLFVGDVAEMPTFTLAGDATDRPYCAVDGDLVPDMYYGRFSATNPSQLQAQLDKTMVYDQFTMADPSYLDTVTLIAGVDSGWAPTHGNGQINYGTEHYFNLSHGITSNTYLYPASSGAVEAEIIQTVNDGVALINYTAHGSETGWYDPAMGQSDINGMTNDGKYGLAIGNCCLTSTYDYGECFGETFLRAANKGVVGYIGGSNSTYWDEDYWWGVGFHPSSQIDGTAWPVASTGMGAYDGIFHENGESEDTWYVTNDAYIFAGNLAVMESGSSRIEYYWNIYNLLGDPSLSTYIAPVANTVGHQATVFVGTPSLVVTADPGSYVGLTQDGVLVGAGTVGAGGSLEIAYLDLLTPGVPLKMVVTAQNRIPYLADLNVIVPATVTIDPLAIDVNTPTDITVTVMDAAGTTPQPGIDVWAEGLYYQTAPVATDANGVAVISVNAAYGPTLDIVGQDPAETYRLFTEQVTVNAATLTAPDLTVATGIGLSDAFALNLPGTLTAGSAKTGGTLAAILPDGTLLDTDATSLEITPAGLGQVTGIIAIPGYDLYTETFDVIEAYGTVAGTVTTGGAPLAGVTVRLVDQFGGTEFSVQTAADGTYAGPAEVLVDDYSLVIDHFGYLHSEQAVFVNYGANVFDADLVAAPSGVLSGTVIDADTYEPLEGTVKVYRTDTGELYTETTCAPDGTFATSALPYFAYEIRVRAWHHVPASIVMTINQATVVKNFALAATSGDLLLIDDGGAAAKPAKFGGKQGDVLLAEAYVSDGAKSAAQMAADLESIGYFVTTAGAADVDVNSFFDYDLVILSCGDNTTTLANTALKAALIDFAQAGGHLLLEGGELGYDQYGDTEFATWVLHSNDWNHDESGNVTVADDTAWMMNHPNNACVPLTLTYAGYGDSDAMVPLPDAAMPMNWSTYPTDASVITYDPNPAPEGGQIVYFAWNYMAVDQGRYSLLENAVLWLMTPEVGNCSISGQALLAGGADYAGITVSATPNGGSVTTGPDGTYTLSGLYAGTYTVKAEKANWGTQMVEVTLADGEQRTGVDLVLMPISELELCSAPNLPITDNAAFSDVVDVAVAGTVSEVAVYVDVTHTWRGDLIATLTSPTGTAVVLHNRTGSSADDLIGWYPAELTPAEDLAAFFGEEMEGEWTLTISDNAGGDTGTFNSWCLHLVYDEGPVAAVLEPLMVSNTSGGMLLEWSVVPAGIDGFNVYRRAGDGVRVRLNEAMIPVGDGHLRYVDSGEGLTAGTVVVYSYALVQGGAEMMIDEVEATFEGGLPRTFAVHPNYPNPFNPMTNIHFDLARPGHVRVEIFDVSGRLVKRLVDENRPAAAHTVVWDGTNESGGRVASGAYYVRVRTDRDFAVQKMMLVK
ncbi:carboxypeptidase regulatory-like domain-containing protein [bacterium]|nr:carboxypeptidase regulatory-like domain-containing protein [bacterium]